VDDQTVRVMTWNLWWRFGEWEQRIDAILAVIRNEQPDILMLQECWRDGDDSLAERLGSALPMHVAETDDPFEGRAVGFHNALLSRWPLSDVESLALPNAAGEPAYRRLLLARTQTPWGPWPIGCTHIDYRFDESHVRQRQVAAIADAVASRRSDPATELPMLLGADLNATPDTDEVRMLTGRTTVPVPGLVFSDCWEQAGQGDGLTWRSDNPYRADTAWPNRRIDYVLVAWPRPKPIGNPQRAWLAGLDAVDGVWPSDHAAVVVDVRSPGSAEALG
jgi:endonuclease/exonuclease/phosphatase family metal-dependent hydrolase